MRKQEIEHLFEEIISGNFCNLMKGKDEQVEEGQRVAKIINTDGFTPRHIIIKISKG